MAAIGMGLGLIAYGMMFNGWVLLKGYDLTFNQIWAPNWPILKPGTQQKQGTVAPGIKETPNFGG